MSGISLFGGGFRGGLYGNSFVRLHASPEQRLRTLTRTQSIATGSGVQAGIQKVRRLQESLKLLDPAVIRARRFGSNSRPAQPGSARSISGVDFGQPGKSTLTSTEEINTAATSYSSYVPTPTGSTLSAPWALDSTAEARVEGTYDGSSGSGVLTFKVRRGGTRGQDDLQLRVLDPEGEKIEDIRIRRYDSLNKVYTLKNGLEFTLGAGDLAENDTFEVNVSTLGTSFTPTDPQFIGSTSEINVGGSYNGQDGTGTLTFKVDRGGVRGRNDIHLSVYDPDGRRIDRIRIGRRDDFDEVYELDNGVTFSLGAGDVLRGQTFEVNVDAGNPNQITPAQPEWISGTAQVTLGGTYDGSSGNGTLSFVAERSGTRGEDNLKLKVYDTDGSVLDRIEIHRNDPLDKVYELANGLTFTVGEGTHIQGEVFEVNVSVDTSFSTNPHPVRSTADIILNGVYDGSLGTTDLGLYVAEGGTHGQDDITLELRDLDNNVLETVSIAAGDAHDRSYTLSNGLTFTVGGGRLVTGENFQFNVDHETPSVVNLDGKFNSPGEDRPNFDAGLRVTAGSFDINGTTIQVHADDSVNSVLERINNSDADVIARFDADTETIQLERRTSGANYLITAGNDTSGFLAATKLADAVATRPGSDADTVIHNVEGLSAIRSGSFRINGERIRLNVRQDSLNDVVRRINESDAGVRAQFNERSGRLTIINKQPEDLVLDSRGTRFFETLAISSRTYEATPEFIGDAIEKPLTVSDRHDVVAAFSEVSNAFNAFFDTSNERVDDRTLRSVRSELKSAISRHFRAQGPNIDSGFGFSFQLASGHDAVLSFDEQQAGHLDNVLESVNGLKSLRSLLYGSQSGDGLADKANKILRKAQRDLAVEERTSAYNHLFRR